MSLLPYPPPRLADEFFAWSVAEGARNPGNWIFDADALMASARLVVDGWRQARTALFSVGMTPQAAEQMRQHPELWAADVFMMLAGMAVEDLLKAIILIREPALVQPNPAAPTQMLDRSISSHDLARLGSRAGISLDADERSFASRLSSFVLWVGRYPLAKTLQAMAPVPGGSDLRSVEDPKDVDAAEALFRRLRTIAWDAQLNEYAPRQQDLERSALREARIHVEAWLEEHTVLEVTEDGTSRYVAKAGREEPGAAIACCGCGRQVNLDGSVRAATCGCGVLYFLDWVFCGGTAPSAYNWSFPPDGLAR